MASKTFFHIRLISEPPFAYIVHDLLLINWFLTGGHRGLEMKMLCNKTSSYPYVKLNFLNFLIFNCSINGINKWIIINYFLGLFFFLLLQCISTLSSQLNWLINCSLIMYIVHYDWIIFTFLHFWSNSYQQSIMFIYW
jgi:hypothetical protein